MVATKMAMEKMQFCRFPLEWKADQGLVIGYANKAIVDDGRDYIPAEAWFSALQAFFREGMPVKLLHRPSLIVGETVWLKITDDGLLLASRPLFPEVKALIERGLLRAYSIGYYPREMKIRPDGVRVITKLDLLEVSYVDDPMNRGCFFMEKMKMDHEVVFDAEKGVVSILGVTPDEMGQIAAALQDLLVKAGVPKDAKLQAIEFKAASPEKPEEPKEEVDENVDWNEVLENYYKLLDGEKLPEEKDKWTRRYINRLPDSSFAVIEPAYERGETKD
ncbi:MAG: HK97 family phage prohead protease, partial [Hadesarchaea archaeon]|nr:HK97 family phage prohead protease [Hadesarchaea archaeon]